MVTATFDPENKQLKINSTHPWNAKKQEDEKTGDVLYAEQNSIILNIRYFETWVCLVYRKDK